MLHGYGMSYFFNNSYLGDQYPRTRFDAMVDGYAAKPFIYRQLVPMLIRSIDQATVPSFRDDVNDAVERFKYASEYEPIRRYMSWFGGTFPLKVTHYKRLVGSLIIFGFLVGYMAGLISLDGKCSRRNDRSRYSRRCLACSPFLLSGTSGNISMTYRACAFPPHASIHV